MSYQKPICECDEYLTVATDCLCDISWKINENGQKSKKLNS